MNRISVFYEHMAEAMKQESITLDEVCAAVKRFGNGKPMLKQAAYFIFNVEYRSSLRGSACASLRRF